MKKSQEDIFITSEADAWFERNISKATEAASKEHNVIKGMISCKLPISGSFIDLGGGTGTVAAGIIKLFPKWKGTVLEPSQKARTLGLKTFPMVDFIHGSLSKKENIPNKSYDLAIISMVFTWIDRNLLSQAIANTDSLVKPGGHIIIQDFYAPFPKINNYHHKEGLFTYKQDYTLPFIALNTYLELYKKTSSISHANYDNKDPYDVWLTTSVLQKDLIDQYQKTI